MNIKKIVVAFILLLSLIAVHAQDLPGNYLKFPNTYGAQYPRWWVTGIMHLPDTTYKPSFAGAIAVKGPGVYVWDSANVKWVANVGSGITATQLHDSLNTIGLQRVFNNNPVLSNDNYIDGGGYGVEFNNFNYFHLEAFNGNSFGGITLGDQTFPVVLSSGRSDGGGHGTTIVMDTDSLEIIQTDSIITVYTPLNPSPTTGTLMWQDNNFHLQRIRPEAAGFVTLHNTDTITATKLFKPTINAIDGDYGYRFFPIMHAQQDNMTMNGVQFKATLDPNGHNGVIGWTVNIADGGLHVDNNIAIDGYIKATNARINFGLTSPGPFYYNQYDTSGTRLIYRIWNTSRNIHFGPTQNSLDSGYKVSIEGALKVSDTIEATKIIREFSTIGDMQKYTGIITNCNVSDSLRGGEFALFSGSYTADNGIIFAATGMGAGYYWKRIHTQIQGFNVLWWPVKNDSTEDNTVGIQTAINYVNNLGGGTLTFPRGKYIGSDTLKSNVHIQGGAFNGYTFYVSDSTASSNTQTDVSWTMGGNPFCLTTPDPPSDGSLVAVSSGSIMGITFVGKGAGTPGVGIHAVSWRRGEISHCSFRYFADQAILQDKPGSSVRNGALTIRDCYMQFICMDTVTSSRPAFRKKGVIELRGNDSYLENLTISAQGGATLASGNGNIIALYMNGADARINSVTCQQADIGVYIDTGATRILAVNFKTDLTNREGIVLNGTAGNTIQGMVKRSGQETTNTYDAVSLINTVTSTTQRNKLAIFVTVGGGASAGLPRYAFGETLSTTNPINHNDFSGCYADASSWGTALFNTSSNNGSYFSPNMNPLTDGTATPTINGNDLLIANTGTTITNFLGGTPAQQLTVFFSSATTVTNNANIVLKAGANYTYAVNAVAHFIYKSGVWYEDGNTSVIPVYIDSAEHTIASTITWNGTPPSGTPNITYQWQRVGHWVTASFVLNYSVAGTTNSSLTIGLPSDMPAPQIPAGFSGNNIILRSGSGSISTSQTSAMSAANKALLQTNSTNTGYQVFVNTPTAIAATTAYITIVYPAQ